MRAAHEELRAPIRPSSLTELVQGVSRARTPQEAAFLFGASSRHVFPADGFLSASIRRLPPGEYKITRKYLDGRLPGSPNETNPWRDWDSLPLHTGGFIGAAIDHGRPQLIHDMDVREDPVLGDALARFGVCAVLPIFDEGEPLNWVFEFLEPGRTITEQEFELRLLLFNLHGRSTKNLIAAHEVAALNKRLREQLERVAEIQRFLLPEQTPRIDGVQIATSYLTSDEAGGDYYDFVPLSDGRWGVFVGDVSGHGAGAATVVAMLHAILRTYPDPAADPGQVLDYLNLHLCEKRIEGNFVTAFFGVLDPVSRAFRFANAGHHPPRLKRPATGTVTPLDGEATIPLGIMDEFSASTNSVRLESGDTIVLFTDGITEAWSPEPNREMYGLDRLDAALTGCSGMPECVVDSIHASLFEHTQSRRRDDDQTIVALRMV